MADDPKAVGGLTLGKGLQAGGALLGGAGSAMQSFGWANSSKASAKANRMLSAEATKKAAWEVTTQRLVKRRLLSNQQFAAGFAGIQLTGTARDVLDETAREMTLNEEMTTREGQVQSAMYLEEAKQNEKAARDSKTAGYINMGASAAMAGAMLLSDRRAKENIVPVTGALSKLRELAAYRYNYRGSDTECIGFLAQEVEKVLPEAVQERDGRKMVDLCQIQALIAGGLKELGLL